MIGGASLPSDLRRIRWPSGRIVDTPLLVPSFSSKGFALVGDGETEPVRSDVSDVLETLCDQLHAAFLVSAYDLHHRLLAAGDALENPDWTVSSLSRPEVLIIDSGGYEATPGADGGELMQDFSPPRDWTPELYEQLLDRLPEAAENCAAVAWDRPGESYDTQLRLAQESLAPRTRFVAVVLLKPPDTTTHDFRQLEPFAGRLAAFAMVGVTDSELGRTLLDRVVAILQLRDVLTRAGLDLPIHIFGALDPLFVPLYFAAGADVFDGLTWLRYAYWHGLAIHREQGALLSGTAERRDDVRRWVSAASNLTQLAQLHSKLLRFHAEGGDWTLFDDVMIGRDGERTGEALRSVLQSAMARRT